MLCTALKPQLFRALRIVMQAINKDEVPPCLIGSRRFCCLWPLSRCQLACRLAAARDDVLFVHGRSAAHNRDTAVYQSAYIEINWQALQGSQGQRIKINLFDDQLLIGIRDRLDPSSAANGFVWVGHLEGQPGSMVTLSAVDGLLIGSISWDGFERYTIRYDGSRQLLNAHDQTAVTEIEGPDAVTIPEPIAKRSLSLSKG